MAEFAGTLSERITLERGTRARSTAGLQEAGWEPYASCLAAVMAEGVGSESEGMTFSAMPRFRLMVRTREDVEVDDRVRWRGRFLMIRQVLLDPRASDRLTLKCEEVRG